MSKLLPPNSTKFEMNFENAFARVSDVELNIRSFNDPLNAPVEVLPWLAWERSVDIWDKDWTEIQKRQVIKNSFYNHSIKGTVASLEVALGSLGFPVIVQEWFNMVPIGKPYTFEIFIESSQETVSLEQIQYLQKNIKVNKNLRSHLIGITLTVKSESEVFAASAVQIGDEFEFSSPAQIGNLLLDGTWMLNGFYRLEGLKN